MVPRQPDAPASARQEIELVDDRGAASEVGRDGGAGHTQLGERPDPEDETGTEHDVEDVAEDQDAHRRGGVADAAEHRVLQEQQQHRRVAGEHHRREAAAGPDDVLGRAHQPQQRGRRRVRRSTRSRRQRRARAAIDCAAARAAPSGSCSPVRLATSAVAPIESPIADRVDDRQHRLGEPDGRDRVGAEVGDPEHVGDGEDRLHRHLHHHRHGEHDHGACRSARSCSRCGNRESLRERAPILPAHTHCWSGRSVPWVLGARCSVAAVSAWAGARCSVLGAGCSVLGAQRGTLHPAPGTQHRSTGHLAPSH